MTLIVLVYVIVKRVVAIVLVLVIASVEKVYVVMLCVKPRVVVEEFALMIVIILAMNTRVKVSVIRLVLVG